MQATKGKQATKGQKQIFEENKATIRFYVYMIVAGAVLYAGVSYLVFRETTSTTSWVTYFASVVVQLGSLQFMRYMSKPVLNPNNGQLVDAGLDINLPGGVAEYCKDAIILSTGLQGLALISSYFWLLFTLCPVYLFYKLWTVWLAPWFFSPGAETDAEADERKRKKKERKIVRIK